MSSTSRHHSAGEAHQRASTGLAIRRGELKISEPVPVSSTHETTRSQGNLDFERASSRKAGTWPSGFNHGRSISIPPLMATTPRSISAAVPFEESAAALRSSKSTVSRRKDTGLRATLRRMFSARRGSSTKALDNASHNVLTEGSANLTHGTSSPPILSPLQQDSPPTKMLPLQSCPPHTSFVTSALPKVVEESRTSSRRRNTVTNPVLSNEEPGRLMHEGGVQQSLGSATRIKHSESFEIQLKRRSKSADAIPDKIQDLISSDPGRQNRMGEIAFWRNSVIADPLPALKSPRAPGLPGMASEHDLSVLLESTQPSLEPLQHFNFELDHGDGTFNPIAIDERVNTLEIKMVDFEYALAKLQGNDLPRPNFSYRSPGAKVLHKSFPEEAHDTNALSTTSSRSFRSPTQSSSGTEGEEFIDSAAADRTSKATIKALPKPGNSEAHGTNASSQIRASQYEALLDLVRGEQAARQQLEIQLIRLEKEMQALRTPTYASIRPNVELTPSPDSIYDSSMLTQQTISKSSPHFYGPSSFQETSRFSMTESDVETETEDHYPEVFETPQESHFAFDYRNKPPFPDMI